jgi:dipeptidyl aminopeptidase/acylaminoacyl peptidase
VRLLWQAPEGEELDTSAAPIWAADSLRLVVKCRAARSGQVVPEQAPSAPTLFRSIPAGQTGEAQWAAKQVAPFFLAVIEVVSREARLVAADVPDAAVRLSPDASRAAYLKETHNHFAGTSGAVPTFGGVHDLSVLDLATGNIQIVAHDVIQYSAGYAARTLSWSPDGHWLAYLSGEKTVVGLPFGYVLSGDLYIAAADGTQKPQRLRGGPIDGFDTLSTQLLWDQKSQSLYLASDQQVWRASLQTMRVDPITAIGVTRPIRIVQASESEDLVWSPDGSALYVFVRDNATQRCGVVRVDTKRKTAVRVYDNDGHCSSSATPSAASTPGDKIVFLRESATESPDLWAANADFTKVEPLTALNPQFAAADLAQSRLIAFRSADGDTQHAALLLPHNYVVGKRYPLVVWVYPGSDGGAAVNTFGMTSGGAGFNMQLLATRGYVILNPDVPQHPGTIMEDLKNAVMPAIDRAVELGIADPDRLAVMGTSAGGYSVIALLTQTQRFKAAVMNAGFGDLTLTYGYMSSTGDAFFVPLTEQYQLPMGGPPWVVPQRYVQNSPIFYLDRVQTPLLIQVGKDDAPFVAASDQIFVGLKRLGRDVTYLQYSGEGHYIRGSEHLKDYWTRVFSFLKAHLKP